MALTVTEMDRQQIAKHPSLSSEFLFQYVGCWHPLSEKELVSFPVNWQ